MQFNYRKIFFLGFGSFGFTTVWVVYNNFVPLFLQERFLMAPAMIGFFMTLDNIAALFIQPPMGAWSDRVRTRIGRRMPFIITGIPVAAAAFIFIPLAMVLPLFVCCTVTLILSMAIWRTPVVALLADITPSRHRSQANGITNFMGGIGGIIAAVGGGALFMRNQAWPFWMGAGLVILAGIMLFIFIKEPREYKRAGEVEPELMKNLMLVVKDRDRSALFLFLAHFFWYIALNAIEAFFTLYAKNHLGYPGGDGSRILGQFLFTLVLFALPAGYIGGKIGRKRSIMTGIVLLIATLLAIYASDKGALTRVITKLPVLGTIPMVGILLMVCGASWMMVNVNSLPMVVDMTDDLKAGTYTGIYYLFITASAIAGPNINGWIIQLTGHNYNNIWLASPLFFSLAFIMMIGVRRGEVKPGHAPHAG